MGSRVSLVARLRAGKKSCITKADRRDIAVRAILTRKIRKHERERIAEIVASQEEAGLITTEQADRLLELLTDG